MVFEYGRVEYAVIGMVLVEASRILLFHISIAVSISVHADCWWG